MWVVLADRLEGVVGVEEEGVDIMGFAPGEGEVVSG